LNNKLGITTLSQSYHALSKQERDLLYLFCYFVISLISWLITNQASAYTANWLGRHRYGEFAVCLRLTHNVAHLFVMGQEATLLMFLSKYQHEPEKQTGLILWIIRSTVIKSVAVLSIIALVLITNINPFSRPQLLGFIAIPFIVICGIYERFFLFLRHFFVSFIPRGLLHPTVLMVFIYLFYPYTPSTETALLLYTVAFIITSIASAIFGLVSGFSLTKKSDQSDQHKWRIAGIYYTISTLIIKSTPSMALLFLKHLGPNSADVAHFAALCNLIYGFHLLTKPFDSYLKPYVARMYADSEVQALQKIINFVNATRIGTILILFAALNFFSHYFLSSYGDGYSEATLPLALLSSFSLLQYLGQHSHEMLNYTGHQKELSIIMTVQFFLISALSAYLIPKIGIWGAVLAQGIPCVLGSFISSRYLFRKTKLKTYFFF